MRIYEFLILCYSINTKWFVSRFTKTYDLIIFREERVFLGPGVPTGGIVSPLATFRNFWGIFFLLLHEKSSPIDVYKRQTLHIHVYIKFITDIFIKFIFLNNLYVDHTHTLYKK